MYENITNRWPWAHFHFTVYCSFTKKPSSCEWHFSEMNTLREKFRKLSKQFQSRQLQWNLLQSFPFVWFSCLYPGTNTLLIQNNFAAHPQDTPPIKNVTAVYHPPNCTNMLQPPDFGFIKCFKKLYRKHTLTLRLLMSYIYIWSTHSWCF